MHIERRALETPFSRILRFFAQGYTSLGEQGLSRVDLGEMCAPRANGGDCCENAFARVM
jgi:hypothetical protein